MRKAILNLLVLGILCSCGKTKKEETVANINAESKEEVKQVLAPVSDSIMENAVIYEANIRQYSEEEPSKHLPEIFLC